jgi:hypothetical protein
MNYKRNVKAKKFGFKELLPVLQAKGKVRISIADGQAFLWDDGQDFTSVQLPSGVTGKGTRRYRINIYEGTDVISGFCDIVSAGETLGAEKVTNGAFAVDSDWSKGDGWTIAGGVAAKSAGVASVLKPTVKLNLPLGGIYKMTFDVKTCTAGTLTAVAGVYEVSAPITAAANGITFYFAGQGSADYGFITDAEFAGTIDNVVIKEVTAAAAKQGISIFNAEAGGSQNILGGASTIPSNLSLTNAADVPITYKVFPLF